MIYRDEVDAMANAVGLQRADVERDYVLGWLLAGIFGESSLGQTLALKGGNALHDRKVCRWHLRARAAE